MVYSVRIFNKVKVELKKGDNFINTRLQVIQKGLEYLSGVGSEAICKLCISNGGSCCHACEFLKDGVGCQKRNTSCTSWLCGFLSLLLYEAGLLSTWHKFWMQVPGLQFRKDNTPLHFKIDHLLEPPHLQMLGEALAKDIEEIVCKKNNRFYLYEINNRIDLYIMNIFLNNDKQSVIQQKRKLKRITKGFHHFNHAKKEWKKSTKASGVDESS